MDYRTKNKSGNRRKFVLIVVAVLSISAIPAYLALSAGHGGSTQASSALQASTPSVTGKSKADAIISLAATGDWIAHDTINAQAKQRDGSYDYSSMVADLKPYFQRSDIRFCNDPILNGGAVSAVTGYPKFNSPPDFVTSMGSFGCNLVNTASNHSFDYSQANITASFDAWKRVPNTLAVAGENSSASEHDAVHYFTIKGVKFAFLAYTSYINSDAPVQNDYGVNVFTTSFAGDQIREAKQRGAQVIIASMRWGTEFSTNVNDKQQRDAQWLADQGVQLVLGHGSHELQPVQQLTGTNGNKTLVWYSLGNFLNTQIPAETLFNGIAYMTVNPKSFEVSVTGYLPVYVHYEWSAADAAAENINQRSNVHMYLLDDVTQARIDSGQLKTTVLAQRQRMFNTLDSKGLNVFLLTKSNALH